MNESIDHVEITDEDMTGAPTPGPIPAESAKATREFADRLGVVGMQPDPTFGEYEPARIGLVALEIDYAVQEWGRRRYAEGVRDAERRIRKIILEHECAEDAHPTWVLSGLLAEINGGDDVG